MLVAAAPAALAAPAAAMAPSGPPVPAAVASAPVTLGTGPARVSLTPTGPTPVMAPAAGGPQPAASPLGARLQALPENRRIYLILDKLSAAVTPEAIYNVYVDLPEGTPDDPINSHYVGTINFFDAAAHGDHPNASKPYSFDITAALANLQARGALRPEHTVTIVPSGKPSEEARAVVGEISIAEQ
jgi:hypothetical protein